MLRDERLEHAGVAILRVAEVEDLVQKFVDEHEVILHVLLADLAEVRLHDFDHLREKLEDHAGVDVLLGDGAQPDVRAFGVEEARASDVHHREARLLPGVNDIDTKGVDRISTDVVAIDTLQERDERA